MSKILPDGRIQVESGDTLSGIYGSNWKELSGFTGDPTKLQVGTTLPAKPADSLGGSIAKEEEKTLPNQQPDRLSVFGDVLKMVTERAAKDSMSRGGEALPEGMLKPEQMSGGSFADVMKLTTEQKSRGIADIYESTMQMVEDTKTKADKQLTMLINTGAIAELDSNALQGLADLTSYPLDYLQAMKKVAISESTDTSKMTDASRIVDLNNFLKDKIGEDTKISSQDYIAAYKRWIGLNGSINDFKYAYPVEEWLGEHEWENLPAGWQPKAQDTVQDVSTLPEAQQIFIQQVQNEIVSGRLSYNEAVEKYPAIAVHLKGPGW